MISKAPTSLKITEEEKIMLEVNHKYFNRNVIVAIVNIVIFNLLIAGLLFLMITISTSMMTSNNSNTPVASATPLLICLLFVLDIIYFAYNAMNISNIHKKITAIEQEVFAKKKNAKKIEEEKSTYSFD